MTEWLTRYSRAILYLLTMLVLTLWLFDEPPYDSTDRPPVRSGMGLHIDSLTGCHYLSRWLGGITPRLDNEGRHICTGEVIDND